MHTHGSGRRYRREKRLGALVLRLTSEVGAHNKIQSDRTNHRSPTGEIGGFDWTYGNWLSNELISLTPRPNRWAIITDRVADCLAIAYFRCFRLLWFQMRRFLRPSSRVVRLLKIWSGVAEAFAVFDAVSDGPR